MPFIKKGDVVAPEIRAKISASMKGKKNSLGHKQSDEHRAKSPKFQPGNQYAKGNKLSPEHKEKLRLSNLGHKMRFDHTPQSRSKLSIANGGDGINTGPKNRTMKAKYGIILSEYNQLLESQNGVCKICGGVNKNGYRLNIDHDHETGKIRGLLCSNCNRAIGLLHDNSSIVKIAYEYLEKNK